MTETRKRAGARNGYAARMRRRHRSASPYEEAVGFSRALRVGRRILVAGTAPIGPDGRTVPGDVSAQARRCFELVVEAVRALHGAAGDIVRTRIYLVDARDADAVGRVHREFLHDARPAATMVVVAGLLDPAWRVEVEAEAVVED